MPAWSGFRKFLASSGTRQPIVAALLEGFKGDVLGGQVDAARARAGHSVTERGYFITTRARAEEQLNSQGNVINIWGGVGL